MTPQKEMKKSQIRIVKREIHTTMRRKAKVNNQRKTIIKEIN